MSTVANSVVLGNANQAASITRLLAMLSQVRGITATALVIATNTVITVSNYVIAGSSIVFNVIGSNGENVPNFPPIECKKTGRFALPTIRSYREANVPDLLAYPGNTAFDAALFADSHVLKQSGAFRRAPQSVLAENVGGMAAQVQAQVPVPAPVESAPVGISPETGQDAAKLLTEIQGKPVDASAPSDAELEKLTAPAPSNDRKHGRK